MFLLLVIGGFLDCTSTNTKNKLLPHVDLACLQVQPREKIDLNHIEYGPKHTLDIDSRPALDRVPGSWNI